MTEINLDGHTSENTEMRLAKAIARAGICSRRDAEKLIADERVSVNGKMITSPATSVNMADKIVVDGKRIPAFEPTRLWTYHKPAGLINTTRDEKGRDTIFEDLPAELPRVITIGRLDLNSEGLLLLTNDGDFARKLELPANGWERTYRVRVHGAVNQNRLKALENGITIDGVRYDRIKAHMENDSQISANTWLKVTLVEGKNREIRRVMEHLGYPVNRLIRVSYGPFALADLKKSEVREVTAGQIKLKALGEKPKQSWAKAKPKNKVKPLHKARAKKARAKKAGKLENEFSPRPMSNKTKPIDTSSKSFSAKKAFAKKSFAKKADAKRSNAHSTKSNMSRLTQSRPNPNRKPK